MERTRPMKKHSKKEILAKLARADALARDDVRQQDICRALGGISIMTLHRWRKRYPAAERAAQVADAAPTSDQRALYERLMDENRRLRKLITDILLTTPARIVLQPLA